MIIFCKYLEYSQHPDIDENVAVIVCGRQTKFLRYYSNQYEDIKHCLGIFFKPDSIRGINEQYINKKVSTIFFTLAFMLTPFLL